MGEYGLEITQGGVSVDQAADYQKVVDDRWPFLEVVHEEYYNVDLSDFSVDTVVLVPMYKHNLGFIPAYTAYQTEFKTAARAGREPAGVTTVADDKYVYAWCNVFQAGAFFDNFPVHTRWLIRVFNVDITRSFQQEIVTTNPAPSRDRPQYGLWVLAEGNSDIDSTNLADFSANTEGKSLSVQRTGIATVDNSNKFYVNHRLGYHPIFYITQYMLNNTYLGGAFDALNGAPRVGTLGYKLRVKDDNQTLTFRGGQSGLAPGSTWAYLILKDPLEGTT